MEHSVLHKVNVLLDYLIVLLGISILYEDFIWFEDGEG